LFLHILAVARLVASADALAPMALLLRRQHFFPPPCRHVATRCVDHTFFLFPSFLCVHLTPPSCGFPVDHRFASFLLDFSTPRQRFLRSIRGFARQAFFFFLFLASRPAPPSEIDPPTFSPYLFQVTKEQSIPQRLAPFRLAYRT